MVPLQASPAQVAPPAAVQPQPTGRIPSLDGLRAVSIALVLIWHLSAHSRTIPFYQHQIDLGFAGVSFFFVISGFIITTLMRKESDSTGTVSLRNFYLRRVFRIVPALATFLAGVWVLMKLNLAPAASAGEMLRGFFFVGDYVLPKSESLVHLWSLSVEEQFYILWPLAFVLLFRRNPVRIATAVMLLSPISRIFWWRMNASFFATDWHFESVADAIAIGCLLALKRKDWQQNRWYSLVTQTRWAALLPLIALLACATSTRPLLYNAIGKSVLFLSAALIIDAVISRPGTLAGRLLNTRAAVALGGLSYSLYLWQQPFTMAPARSLAIAWFPVNVIIPLAIAFLSNRLIELPAQAYGKRFIASLAP